jgi:DNA replication and repair protein RecF
VTPVRITELVVDGFRNLRGVRIIPDERANVLLGANGHGKTAILEAIDYAASLRSFRGAMRAQLVGHERDDARVLLRVESAAMAHEYRVRLTRTTREILLDGKRPQRAVEYFGGASCVVFQPGDLDLVRGAPELRRRLLDRILVRVLDGYGEALKNYVRALKSRNQLLREGRPEPRAVQAFDFPLARYGAALVRARNAIVPDLVAAAQRSLYELGLDPTAIAVTYRTRCVGDQVEYAAALASQRTMDITRRSTQYGPHSDDLALTWEGFPARVVASQGQTRTLALALRLAELHVIESRAKLTPVLLLDDVSSELDRTRIEQLFTLVATLGGQVWVSTTDPAIGALLPRAKTVFVTGGTVTET